ncbi:MAG TPA: hypothetical protein ENL08_03800 [Bacteroidetes bacterium]|nr:hypothetical protein [Bacteroidota bacterium]
MKERAADDVTGELTRKLPLGLKKRKVKEPRREERVKFRVSTELVEVSLDPIDGGRFEVSETTPKSKAPQSHAGKDDPVKTNQHSDAVALEADKIGDLY